MNNAAHDSTCNVCGSTDISCIEPRKGLTYVRCSSCGHCSSAKLVDDLSRTFHEAQGKYYGETSQLLSSKLDIFEVEVLAQRIQVLSEYIPHACDVIEVGPGAGHVLRWLDSRGHKVSAIEHSSILAQQITEQLEISVINGEFETLEMPAAICDAFCSFHVIEHVRDPLEHLKKAHALVRPGGLAFVATPNSRSWQQILFETLSPNFDSAHLCVFSTKSLRILCERSGWQIIATLTPESTVSWIRVLTKGLRRLKGEDEEQTAGKYAQSSSNPIRIAKRMLKVVTLPFRLIQCKLGYGNEVFLVLRKPPSPLAADLDFATSSDSS